MPLSLHQTRQYIDRLGDLENELTRSCRVAEVMAKDAGKDQAAAAGRLKDSCESARDHLKYVAEAKNRLLEFDGFLHAQSGAMRESLARPQMAGYLNEVGGRMSRVLEHHVETISDEAIEALRRVAGGIKDLREARAGKEGDASAKASVKALDKVCAAAEKAIREGVKERRHEEREHEAPEVEVEGEEVEGPEEEEAEVEVEKMAHGYNLTAGLPPEFLENAQKKKDEAKGKKDDEDEDKKKDDKKASVPDHGYVLTAESKVPGNESKGPEEEGDEDEGWVPGHRTKDKGKEAAHGYNLTAGRPSNFDDYIESKKFRHPETGNEVQFGSLPQPERKKIAEEYRRMLEEYAAYGGGRIPFRRPTENPYAYGGYSYENKELY